MWKLLQIGVASSYERGFKKLTHTRLTETYRKGLSDFRMIHPRLGGRIMVDCPRRSRRTRKAIEDAIGAY